MASRYALAGLRMVNASEVMRYLFKFSLDSVDKNNQRVYSYINANLDTNLDVFLASRFALAGLRMVNASEVMRYLFRFSLSSVDKI